MADLNTEAEELRKEKKRNTVSGIHKYNILLQIVQIYAKMILIRVQLVLGSKKSVSHLYRFFYVFSSCRYILCRLHMYYFRRHNN